ncbi:hypothetical protein HYPSUDRAFT_43963, partial [Hypholoma sublateritium FD-334 SS-4]
MTGPAAYPGASLAPLRIPLRACSVPCSVPFIPLHRNLPCAPCALAPRGRTRRVAAAGVGGVRGGGGGTPRRRQAR